MLKIEISNQQTFVEVDRARMVQAAEAILADASIDRASLSIAVVDDATIHPLNREYLDHDCPTDVLSFLLESEPGLVDGEVIVSAETAARRASEFGWSAEDELLLYLIHGTLHLVGYDDSSADALAAMRVAERRYLARFGLQSSEEKIR